MELALRWAFVPCVGAFGLALVRIWPPYGTGVRGEPDELPRLGVCGGVHGLVGKALRLLCMWVCVGSRFGP